MAVVPSAQACSRLVYKSPKGPITARSMDWFHQPDAKLWVFPKGMERNGGAGTNSITWTSKYGSIITSSYDIATVDGINDQGLVANLLFLEETDYGTIEPCENTLSVGGWGQYVLDNYATVAEAVEALEAKPFEIVTATFNQLFNANLISEDTLPKPLIPLMGELKFGLHLALSDTSGDSAIFEYIDGELKVHHSRKYDVLTNDPTFNKQVEIKDYWEPIYTNKNPVTNQLFLPGSNSSSDRFVRASYYLDAMHKKEFIQQKKKRRNELAAALGIIRNVSDPLGLDSFAFTTTQWRTVASQNKNPKRLAYFFEYTKSPNLFWVMMSKLKLEEGADVMVLEKIDDINFAGEVSGHFQDSAPFSWDISATMNN